MTARPPDASSGWVPRAQRLVWVAVLLLGGLLWWNPDAVSKARRWFLPHADAPATCDLSGGPCTATFPDGTQVTATVFPLPPRSGVPMRLTVHTDSTSAPTMVELQGTTMSMGVVRAPMARDDGVHLAEVHLPICTTERMHWQVDVLFADQIAGFTMTASR